MKSLLLLLWTLHVSLVAAQACEERDIRITNQKVNTSGNTFTIAGGLQICVGSQWGTVCQNKWSENNAIVACRQLGLDYADESCRNSCFKNIQTNPSYTRIICRGNESSLHECGRTTRMTGCGNAAGIYCETAIECEEKELRMTGRRVTRNGDTYYMAGGFEMCVNGQWATVCQNQWRDSEATVACRQLGFLYNGNMCNGSCLENFQANRAYKNIIGCSGNEDTLYECNRAHNTGCTSVAGVYCELNITSLTATCDMATEKSSRTNTTTISHGSDPSTTDLSTTTDVSLPTTTSLCPTNAVSCEQCSPNSESASNSPAGNMRSSEKSKEKTLCDHNSELALGVVAALLGVAVTCVIIILIICCFKLREHKYQVENSKIICVMDNNVYGATELPENIQQFSSQDDLASPYSVPLKHTTEIQNVSPALESLYDAVTTENSASDDGIMYSVLNHDNANKSRMKKLHSSMSDEQDSGSDPIYHILEVEESQMYNNVN